MSNQPNNEEKKDDNKNKKDDEPEEEEYSCGLCCRGYANCIFCCCKVILSLLRVPIIALQR
jgi:hypothetical protein